MEEQIARTIYAELYVLFQSLVALVLGGLIGWERETAKRWAGLRTHMLVCLSAMLFVKIGLFLIDDSSEAVHSEVLRSDPVRIIQSIVIGVSFLGAGTIFRDRDAARMRGLTTAASLLIITPIGIAVAIDRYILAVGITLLTLFVLRIVRRLEPMHENPDYETPKAR